MAEVLGVEWAGDWIRRSANAVNERREELNELDRAIGDGDHGENLQRGFSAVIDKLASTESATVADVLKLVATTLMSTVGGAAGPLYGTAFLRAAKVADGNQLDAAAVADLLEAAAGGIVARGKAAVGDKTMVDAWAPAADGARAGAEAGDGPITTLRRAADLAAAGAESTDAMIAHKGRASYLGERAIGHRDPGAQSSALILAAAADAAEQSGAS